MTVRSASSPRWSLAEVAAADPRTLATVVYVSGITLIGAAMLVALAPRDLASPWYALGLLVAALAL